MKYKDYYKILGLTKKAGPEEIKRAYREKARQHHPDLHPDDAQAEARLKEINEAYEVLSDHRKRRKYDRLGASYRAWKEKGDPGGFDWSAWSPRPAPAQEEQTPPKRNPEFSDFFKTMFVGSEAGGSSSRLDPRRGKDRFHPVEITLEEAYWGAARVFQLEGRRVEVNIPRGVISGSPVHVAGEGWPGHLGGPAGDLVLNVRVMPHKLFTRNGNDLYCDLVVDLYTMIVGGNVPVLYPGGRLALKIPPETQNGRTFRLKGKGMPAFQTEEGPGDLLVTVKVALPQNLTRQEKELFQKLATLREQNMANTVRPR